MDLNSLAASIKERALALGFDLCGIAPAEPSAFKPQFLDWLSKGFHGEMGYMARDPDRRTDPQLVLPGAKSIVCMAMNYYTGEEPPDDPERAVFARYARGDDYHDVMIPRLKELLEWIKEECPEVPSSEIRAASGERQEVLDVVLEGSAFRRCSPRAILDSQLSTLDSRLSTPTEGRVYVDTGPILEREVAQRAGLGWFGKNTMLINTRRGSYFLLGEILLNLPLPPDAPAIGGCGTCTKCIDACPTQAIVRPFEIDATRCISYLTIEQKGPIPAEFAEKMGNRIFGCDICQEVCPFNHRSTPTEEPAFRARASYRVAELAGMTEEEFRAAFKGSPVKRAKWKGLRRNVTAALSSSDDPKTEEALAKALANPDELVRKQAATSLGVIRRRQRRSQGA